MPRAVPAPPPAGPPGRLTTATPKGPQIAVTARDRQIPKQNFYVCALGNPTSAAYTSQMHALRLLGRLEFQREDDFETPSDFVSMFLSQGFDILLMPNPYGNKRRLAIYQEFRRLSMPVLCFDRGGLPNSWFFDVGFNADSPTYDVDQWDRPLTDEQAEQTRRYVDSIRGSQTALEAQGARVPTEELRASLSPEGKKILFVPFQRPNDTTIRYFGGRDDAYARFVRELTTLTTRWAQRDADWTIVAKKHPLETERPTSDLLFADDDTHIHDLLEACDAVALVNSGCGLLAALFDKPVYHYGRVYYGHPRLNRGFASAAELDHFLEEVPVRFDSQTRDRLVRYLRDEVYSFGDFQTQLVREPSGSMRRATHNIEFETIRFPISRVLEKKKVGEVFFL